MKLNHLINKYPNIEQSNVILLLENILDTTYSKLMLKNDVQLSENQSRQLNEYIARLKKHEPLQYILGFWDFIDLKLITDSRALIPRPETEILAQDAAALAKKFNNPQVIDIGSGTGCIGLYIKHTVRSADVTLCDISRDALLLAKENAQSLNIDVNFLLEDMRNIKGTYDVIVSNPPYITKEDMARLDKSVADYEPENALYGGDDGLEFYKVLSLMHKNLNDGGYLVVEIGINQDEAVKNLFEKSFREVIIKKDLANIPRVVIARK